MKKFEVKIVGENSIETEMVYAASLKEAIRKAYAYSDIDEAYTVSVKEVVPPDNEGWRYSKKEFKVRRTPKFNIPDTHGKQYRCDKCYSKRAQYLYPEEDCSPIALNINIYGDVYINRY